MPMRGETRLATAAVEASLDAGLLEPIALSLYVADLYLIFVIS